MAIELRGDWVDIRMMGLRRRIQAWHADQQGATMLEYTLLLAVLVIATFPLLMMILGIIKGHYQMIVYLLGLPFI
jgi:Flp pilus assembly pilin Flp